MNSLDVAYTRRAAFLFDVGFAVAFMVHGPTPQFAWRASGARIGLIARHLDRRCDRQAPPPRPPRPRRAARRDRRSFAPP